MRNVLKVSVISVLAALAAPVDSAVASTDPVATIMLARADDPPGDQRHGRGRDDGITPKRQGADNLPGDVRRGRGSDDGLNHKRQGADDPPGDDRRGRGRGRDNAPNHG